MDVRIHYCPICGFQDDAEAIGAALQNEFGLQTTLHKGFWGTFRIEHGGTEVYNRWKTRGLLGRVGLGRQPTSGEIVALFRNRAENARP